MPVNVSKMHRGQREARGSSLGACESTTVRRLDFIQQAAERPQSLTSREEMVQYIKTLDDVVKVVKWRGVLVDQEKCNLIGEYCESPCKG